MMNGVTAGLAGVLGIAILLVKPHRAIGIYLAALFLYPQAMAVNIGGANWTTGRLTIMALCLHCLINGLHKKFRWNWLDTFMMLTYLGRLMSLSQTTDAGIFLKREFGTAFDILLTYFCTRLIVTDFKALTGVCESIVFAGIPIAIMGAWQCKTGHNPIGFMAKYYSFGLAGTSGTTMRSGFYRAKVTFNVAIALGLFFSVAVSMAIALMKVKKKQLSLLIPITGLLLVGLMSSMSSGPLFAIVITLACIAAYPLRGFWWVLLILFIVELAFVEVFSNRHFYHVLAGMGIASSTGSYRIGLMEETFGGGMSSHWLFGWGYVGLHSPPEVFPWRHKDMTNVYIGLLVRYGISRCPSIFSFKFYVL